MTREKYLSALNDCEIMLNNGKLEECQEALERLRCIKPVARRWFILKAKVMFALKYPISEIMDILNGHIIFLNPSNDNEEYFKLMKDVLAGDAREEKKAEFLYAISKTQVEKNTQDTLDARKIISDTFDSLRNAQDAYLADLESAEKLDQLIEYYYITYNVNMYILLSVLREKVYESTTHQIAPWTKSRMNMGYLISRLMDEESNEFIIIEDECISDKECEIIKDALILLNKKVYWLVKPLRVEVEAMVNMEDTVAVSLNNREIYDQLEIITPVEIDIKGKVAGNNTAQIIKLLTQEKCGNKIATILSGGVAMDNLCKNMEMKKNLQRLSIFEADYLEGTLQFGWAGDYLSYISYIYKFDVRKELESPAECDISIVLPARNASYTLIHTIKTCLNQSFKGTYEIVLSDNSTPGNEEVYRMYQDLNNSKIKYYKTPRELSLPRSFEFAFLKAKGRFIFSIGSDDGILPWGLEIIFRMMEQMPDELILAWDRGFYAWPGFNKGQQNQFVIPRQYKKDEINIEQIKGIDLLKTIIVHPDSMYILPMLYINSGFRREYLKKVLEATGTLWDGKCQDIYMGLVNICINKTITYINYPVTIAGMSNRSIGATSNNALNDKDEVDKTLSEMFLTGNMGGHISSVIERLVPDISTDRISLYSSLLRMIARGVLPEEIIKSIDWKNVFELCLQQINVTDITFERMMDQFRNAAQNINNEFRNYFDENYYPQLMAPKLMPDSSEEISQSYEKLYKEGKDEKGSFTVDASRYGVSNIYEATLLFEQLTKL